MDGDAAGLTYPWDTPPAAGEAREVAEGVLWLRLPLPMALDHVNVYALNDGDGWTVVDTGFDSRRLRATWEQLLDGPLGGRPVRRVLVTHHHPDHVGLAGWFQQRGAELWTTRTAWLFARMLRLDEQERPAPETQAFWRAGGMDRELREERAGERPFNFADVVAPMPPGYRRLVEGEVVRLGGRDWDVRMGDGHAPEHATLWSRDDALVLGGDQLLPGISPNISVHATEPLADPLREWLASCARLAAHARPDQLVLPGHKLPYFGAPQRLAQLAGNHVGALARLEAHLAVPRTAAECFPVLFKREIGRSLYGLALGEAMAHCVHMWQEGRVSRELRHDGAWLFQARDTAR